MRASSRIFLASTFTGNGNEAKVESLCHAEGKVDTSAKKSGCRASANLAAYLCHATAR